MKLRHALVAAALLGAAVRACATETCRVEGGCIDDWSVGFVSLYDIYGVRCPEAVPEKADDYRAALRRFLYVKDEGFLKRLRASDLYRRKRAEIEAEIERREPLTTRETCDSLFGLH